MRAAALALGAALLAAPALAAEATGSVRLPGSTVTVRAVSTADRWIVEVTSGSRRLQRFEVESDATEALPWLADADGDGTPDLWVATMQGNANTAWQIWLLDPRDGTFAQGGETSGLAFGRQGVDLISLSRASCCSVVYSVGTFHPAGELNESFAVEVQLDEGGRARACKPANDLPVPRPWLDRLCRLAPGEVPGRIGPPRG